MPHLPRGRGNSSCLERVFRMALSDSSVYIPGTGFIYLAPAETVVPASLTAPASPWENMILVQQAFATGFTTSLTGAITTGFAGLKVATDAGMLSIIEAIRLGGTLMQATLHVAIGLMATDVAAQFVLIQTAALDGMQSIVDTISGSMPAVTSAFDMEPMYVRR